MHGKIKITKVWTGGDQRIVGKASESGHWAGFGGGDAAVSLGV